MTLTQMLSTGIPELTSPNDIQYLRTALCLSLTDEEAAEEFQKLIYESLDTKTTQWNNLAHMIVHRKK
jgi:phosphatidylinositol-4,5-bisphosphate 3-kinase